MQSKEMLSDKMLAQWMMARYQKDGRRGSKACALQSVCRKLKLELFSKGRVFPV